MRDEQALTPPGGGAHVEPWLDAYRTGELEDSERLRVERHLERCPDCAARLAEIESFGRLVARGFTAGATGAAAEPDWDRQRREILARTVEPRPVERRPARLFRFAPQAALAVLALLVLGILVREGVHGPGDLERALEKEKPVTRGVSGPTPPAAVGGEAPAASSGGFKEGLEERPSASDSFASSSRPDEAASADRAPGAEGPPADRDAARPGVEPAAGAGVVGGLEEARKARAAEREELAAAAPAPGGERKRAVALNEAAQKPAAADAKEADFSGLDREAGRAPSEANDSGRAADELQPSRQTVPLHAGPALMDALQRLELYTRKALASRDSVETARALAFWRDSVAFRTDLDPARKRAAAALVDSLARQVPR